MRQNGVGHICVTENVFMCVTLLYTQSKMFTNIYLPRPKNQQCRKKLILFVAKKKYSHEQKFICFHTNTHHPFFFLPHTRANHHCANENAQTLSAGTARVQTKNINNKLHQF